MPAAIPKKKRSENRQRQAMTAMRLHPDEHQRLREAAADRGVSVSEFVRSAVLRELAAH